LFLKYLRKLSLILNKLRLIPFLLNHKNDKH
jgi:hypothetical protein